jgi:rod shape-determining protein MreC
MKSTPIRSWQTIVLVVLAAGIIILALSGYLSPIIQVVLKPMINFQSWVSSRYIAVYEFVTVPKDVASLRQRNQELENEVSKLQIDIIQLQQQLKESQVLYSLLDFARARPENRYVASSVIGRDTSPFLQYIYIDHGSDDGILRGMPVVTQQGLVGRVDAVNALSARVKLITDASSAVNILLEEAKAEAVLTGSVTGDLSMGMIPQDVTLEPDTIILTSGLGGTYPPNIVVGKVISVRKRENELFQTAAIQPAVDFSALKAVLVIVNFQPVDYSPLVPTPAP